MVEVDKCDMLCANCHRIAQSKIEVSPAIRAKISAAISALHKGKKRSVASRAKMSVSRMGKKHSLATRAKIGASHVGMRGYVGGGNYVN